MRNAKQQLIGWALIGFIAALSLCAAGLIVLKVLPPREQSRVMLRLPAPLRVAVNNLLFPHPDIVPTPNEPVKNASLLLTPQATRTLPPQPTATLIAPSPTPAIDPTAAPMLEPSPIPIVSSQDPIVIPTVHAPGATQPTAGHEDGPELQKCPTRDEVSAAWP